LVRAVAFSLVGFSLIVFSLTGFSPVPGFYLTGAVSSVERFISLTGIVQKRVDVGWRKRRDMCRYVASSSTRGRARSSVNLILAR
jgi:hypothetical protein